MSTNLRPWSALLAIALVVLSLVGGCQQAPQADGFEYIAGQPAAAHPYTDKPIRQDAGELRFAVISDRTGGHRPGVFESAIEKLNMLQPPLVMCVGDLIEGYNNDPNIIDAQRKEIRGFTDSLDMRFFYVVGNHDVGQPAQNDAWTRELGPRYYAFTSQGALFLCLDSIERTSSPLGGFNDDQIEWVRKVLAAHPNPRWTFVFFHYPLWVIEEEALRDKPGQPLPKTGLKEVEQALAGRNYTVFTGHFHSYTRYDRNGQTYYTLATTGGATSKTPDANEGEFDEIAWVTLPAQMPGAKPHAPKLVNLVLNGILPEDFYTEADLKIRWPNTAVAEQTDKPLRVAFDVLTDNRFDKPATGKTAWTVPPGSAWKVTPTSQPFTSPPKQVSRQRFVAEYDGNAQEIFPLPRADMELQVPGRTAVKTGTGFPQKALMDYLHHTRPTVKVAKAASAIVCDGNLDKPAWQRPADATGWTSLYLNRRPDVQSEAFLTYDDTNLYLAVRCQEPNMAGIKTTTTKRDGPVYQDDSVEFLVDPNLSRKVYYQFIVSASNVVFDSKGWDSKWDGEFSHGVARPNGAWTVEMAIPWKTLGVTAPAAGTKMGFLLARTRTQSDEITQWPPAPGSNHQPDLFADIEFQGPGQK